jgi:hypothetical protein
MKTLLKLAVVPILLGSLFLSGCGGGGSNSVAPGGLTGVRADGSMSGIVGHARVVGGAAIALNPNYTNACLQPENLSVALTKFELLKSEDDPDPYVVFTATLDDPKSVDLTSGASASFGENASYPTAGTYTHVRMTIVYFKIRFSLDQGEGAGLEPADFQLYASSVGNIKNGDVVRLVDGLKYWMTASTYEGDQAPFAVNTDQGPRPDDLSGLIDSPDGPVPSSICVQDNFFCQPDNVSSDPYTMTLALDTPVVIPANPSGQYRLTANFDVNQSPLDATATGMFMFDDVDGDGIFEPGPGQTFGAGRDCNDGTHGEPQFCILPPLTTITYAQAE